MSEVLCSRCNHECIQLSGCVVDLCFPYLMGEEPHWKDLTIHCCVLMDCMWCSLLCLFFVCQQNKRPDLHIGKQVVNLCCKFVLAGCKSVPNSAGQDLTSSI